ncbi:MAG: flagellar basal body-associated FliL family protein [Lachnospiraceae bacterium]
MKKNLMTVVILALLIVNLALTGIIMFFTVSANQKTIALVNDIAAVLDLELSGGTGEDMAAVVSIEDTSVYNIEDAMTIALKPDADGTEHYALISISFSLNMTDPDYETYQPMMSEKESKIKSEIINVIGAYTKEEAMSDEAGMEEAVLEKIQAMFNSKFVYEAYFRDIKFQ